MPRTYGMSAEAEELDGIVNSNYVCACFDRLSTNGLVTLLDYVAESEGIIESH
mgnify:CR=1 FL=1